MPLLITTPNSTGELDALLQTASIIGWKVYNNGWKIPKNLIHTPGAVYGGKFFCEAVAEQMRWKLISNPINWLEKLPYEYVNRKFISTKLKYARNLIGEKFIKPVGSEVFTAKVYESGSELPLNVDLDETTVSISDVLNFTSKYKCFIKNRKVISACCYYLKSFGMIKAQVNKSENYNNNIDAVIDFMNKVLEDDKVPCVDGSSIDCARFKKDTYTILKSDPSYTSLTYGCDLVAALDSISAACLLE